MFADGSMNLPNYFLADLPPEAALTATMITEACQTLKRNRERYLANRSTQSIVAVLCNVGKDWLTADFEFRKLALDHGPKATGFSRETLASGLDAFFNELTKENFEALLEQDLGNAQRLDQLAATESEQKSNRAAVATGPELMAHITAGNLPCPTLMSIVLGMLARSAQFVKCASGTSFLPRLFAHSIHQADSKLAACLEIAEWRGKNNTDSRPASNTSSTPAPSQPTTETKKPLTVRVLNEALTNALFEHADCVTATGSDETLAAIRRRLQRRILSPGTSWGVFRPISFMSSMAAAFPRSNSPKCWQENWSSAKNRSRVENCRLNSQQQLLPVVPFMKRAPRISTPIPCPTIRRLAFGKAKTRRHGPSFMRQTRAFKFRV